MGFFSFLPGVGGGGGGGGGPYIPSGRRTEVVYDPNITTPYTTPEWGLEKGYGGLPYDLYELYEQRPDLSKEAKEAMAREFSMRQYYRGLGVYDELAGLYMPGGVIETAMLAGKETARRKGTAEMTQATVGRGLYGTTEAANIPAAWEEAVGEQYTLDIYDQLARMLGGALGQKAQYIGGTQGIYQPPQQQYPSYGGGSMWGNILGGVAQAATPAILGGLGGLFGGGGGGSAVGPIMGGSYGANFPASAYGAGGGLWSGIGNVASGIYSAGAGAVSGLASGIGSALAFLCDERAKENIQPIDSALDKVGKLDGKIYNYVFNSEQTKDAGVIAQDVQRVLPEAIIEKDGLKFVKMDALVGLLVNAVKELKAEIGNK